MHHNVTLYHNVKKIAWKGENIPAKLHKLFHQRALWHFQFHAS